jgi:predicted nucleic acid binding AN1-type Zn finger protein
MEFPDVGKFCSHPECHQLDFLPFTCSNCSKVFCLDHRSVAAHACPKVQQARTVDCPACTLTLAVKIGEDADAVIARHLDAGCERERARSKQGFKCRAKGCKARELVPVECRHCRENFCFKHRFPSDHSCARDPKRVAAAADCRAEARAQPAAATAQSRTPAAAAASAAAASKSTNLSHSRLVAGAR